jgi:hypothetical protein
MHTNAIMTAWQCGVFARPIRRHQGNVSHLLQERRLAACSRAGSGSVTSTSDAIARGIEGRDRHLLVAFAHVAGCAAGSFAAPAAQRPGADRTSWGRRTRRRIPRQEVLGWLISSPVPGCTPNSGLPAFTRNGVLECSLACRERRLSVDARGHEGIREAGEGTDALMREQAAAARAATAAPAPSPAPAPQLPPAGWYADKQDPSIDRWFDGTQWTDFTQPRQV